MSQGSTELSAVLLILTTRLPDPKLPFYGDSAHFVLFSTEHHDNNICIYNLSFLIFVYLAGFVHVADQEKSTE